MATRLASTGTLPAPSIPAAFSEALADPARVHTRAVDRVAYANDASHVALTPRAVVTPADLHEVAATLRAATATRTPVTFRSGGTSLSGQAVTDSILIDVRSRFRRIEVLEDGLRVRVQPGATVRQVNARLLRHGRRLGPDPASEIACTVGGVVNNNSSGMACGITENTYRTLESMVFVLPSGTIVDTAADDADAALYAAEPDLVRSLMAVRSRVLDREASVQTIRRRFAMKNTMGYAINAFLDVDTPARLLAQLIIGSEGTLAFVAEATYRTVPIHAHAATGLAVFSDLDAATAALPELAATQARTLELMDATSLRVGQASPHAPAMLKDLVVQEQAALLIEYQADDLTVLQEHVAGGRRALEAANLQTPPHLSTDAGERAAAWKLRKGLYASVSGARPTGTTALLEDIVVPVPALSEVCRRLNGLFERYDYRDSVVFGHAKDGNIHFMLTDRFETRGQKDRYAAFTEDMVDLVLGADGNLKAEHGTGRIMAPFVRRQYGDELYEVMRELKRICDPGGVLNPGVIITDDPQAHMADIKVTDPVHDEIDRCVECGYCEPVCPSKDITLTPRQRIVVRRAIGRAEASGDHELADQLERDYQYDGVDTCAVDGMCQVACPLDINTGDLVRTLRRDRTPRPEAAGWAAAARGWGVATRVGSHALGIARRLPPRLVTTATRIARAVAGRDRVPLYDARLPGGGPARRSLVRSHTAEADRAAAAVYLPACVNSMFGPEGTGIGASEAFLRLAERAGVHLIIPDGIDGLCCGTPWSSKGKAAGHETMRRRVVAAVREARGDGDLPVVSDASSCTQGFTHMLEDTGIHTEDAVTFTRRVLLPRLGPVDTRLTSLTVHPTCSSVQLGLDEDIAAVAKAVSERVEVPDAWGCCAFAGDRGMLHPELTASATAAEAAEVQAIDAQAHASCNRTCEIGMTRATGRPYRHILELLEEATRPVAEATVD